MVPCPSAPHYTKSTPVPYCSLSLAAPQQRQLKPKQATKATISPWPTFFLPICYRHSICEHKLSLRLPCPSLSLLPWRLTIKKVGHTTPQHCHSCSSQQPKPKLTTPLLKTTSLSVLLPSLQKTQTTVSEGPQLPLNSMGKEQGRRRGPGGGVCANSFCNHGHLSSSMRPVVAATTHSQPFQMCFKRQKQGQNPNPTAEAESLTPIFLVKLSSVACGVAGWHQQSFQLSRLH